VGSTPETRVTVLPDAENQTIIASFVWTKHRNVTDRQTDGRTDRRPVLLQRSALRAMRTRCKNGPTTVTLFCGVMSEKDARDVSVNKMATQTSRLTLGSSKLHRSVQNDVVVVACKSILIRKKNVAKSFDRFSFERHLNVFLFCVACNSRKA